MPHIDFDRYQQTANYFHYDNHKLAFWTSAEGENARVLFIHGFPSASCDWYHQWQALQQKKTLLAMDLLGFGLSDKPYPYVYTLVEQARIIAALLKHLQWPHCHIVAHDYGDSVAQELLTMQENRQLATCIDSVTFLNGGLFSEAHRPLLLQTCLKSRFGKLLVPFIGESGLKRSFDRIFSRDNPIHRDEFKMIWRLLAYHQGKRCIPALLQYISERSERRDIWLEAMRRTSTPMQFINGSDDPISGKHMAERVKQLIPAVKVELLPVGHYPQLEAPALCSQLIDTFISTCA